MMEFKLHNRLTSHGEPEMARLNDARVDRSNGNLENPFAFNVAEYLLPLGAPQDSVPSEIFFERVGAFGPVLMADEPAHVRMTDGDQAEHVTDLTLIPFGRVDMGRNGRE